MLRRHRNVDVVLSTVTGFDLEARVVHTIGHPRRRPRLPLRQPDRRRRCRAVLLRPRRVRLDRSGDEDDRRRDGAPPPRLRGPRDRRDARGPRPAALLHDLRHRRRRAHRRGAGRPDPRARRPEPDADFRRIDPATVRVLLFDGGKEPLANFGDRLVRAGRQGARRRWASSCRMGDAWWSGRPARGRHRRPRTARRAASTAAPRSGRPASRPRRSPGCWPQATGAATDRAGRIAVLPDLTLPGHPEVFALGDMATLDDLPGVCEVAMQGGLHAANTIKRRLKGASQRPVQVPRPRQRGRHRPLQGHRERPGRAPERLPRLGGLALRPRGLPERLRPPARRAVALGPRHGRAGAARRVSSASGTRAAT